MTIDRNHTKTSFFLTFLMILTPFAAASTVTTFADESSEVTIQFKDGINSINNTGAGFYLPNNETIVSASMNVSNEPALFSSDIGVAGITSFAWDPNINNGATTVANPAEFKFQQDQSYGDMVSLSSEAIVTDFEFNDFDMDNSTQVFDDIGNPIAWNYGNIISKSLQYGPDTCASGDMCWGTGIFDPDYTDDLDESSIPNGDRHEYRMVTPITYLSPNLIDTYLRFSSWHDLEVKYDSQGDYYYDDCAFLEIEYTSTGSFNGEQEIEHVPFNLQQTSGISPGVGIFAKDTIVTKDKISGECNGLENNWFGLAGTSTNPLNPSGWASLVGNLAPFLGNYAKIHFVLQRNDAPGNVLASNTPGWFVDDMTIGEPYEQESTMIINNIQQPQNDENKSFDGFGMLYLDAFEPADSALRVSILDSFTKNVITGTDGAVLQNLAGPVIELWSIDVDQHSTIDIKLDFYSGTSKISTPILFGYTLGTEYGVTFNDLGLLRELNVVDGEWDFTYDKAFTLDINTADFMSSESKRGFSLPVYGLSISGIPSTCGASAVVKNTQYPAGGPISLSTDNLFPSPIFDFTISISYSSDCVTRAIWVDLTFGHHLKDIEIDFTNDSKVEWSFKDSGYGSFGLQNTFYTGESNGESNGGMNTKVSLDPLTGTAIGGYFLIPKNSQIKYFNMKFSDNSIFSKNNTMEAFELDLFVGTEFIQLGTPNNYQDFELQDIYGAYYFNGFLNSLISQPNVPIIKTDDSGIDWIRVGFFFNQSDSNNGGSVDLTELRVVYELTSQIGPLGLSEYLREYVAIMSQDNESLNGQTYVPTIISSSKGGQLKISDLVVETQLGYNSSLQWNNNHEGLYSTGNLYELITTHEVSTETGAQLTDCRVKFKTQNQEFYLGYSLSTAWYEQNDVEDYITIDPSSSISSFGDAGGKEITWKFSVNANWDDEIEVYILAETVADNGVIGMLSGKKLAPILGNAVENDIVVNDFNLYNSAGNIQNLTNAYSNQIITMVGNVSFEEIFAVAPSPLSYNMLVEQRGFQIDGDNTNITWTEIANRSGFIGGAFSWDVDLGMFSSGSETYRFRLSGYDGGEIICPPSLYEPDSDCGIQFDLSIDILNPNLISLEFYKRNTGEGDFNSDDNWRQVFDDSWAKPKLSQDFRLTVSDLPLPPESAVLHVWVEMDHDENTNGIAEPSEYIEVATTSDVNAPNATFWGTFNDFANSGVKGKVSIWIECYDLAGNPVDGGGPGLANDYVTYVSMELQYPTIKSLRIKDINGIEMVNSLTQNPPEGVGIWNQTMFAGNEYNIIIEAKDGNGWKDVDRVEVELAPQENNYDSTITYFPRNQTAWTESDLFSISTDVQGDSKATIRTIDGNILLDPFEEDFVISIPISFQWGLPLVGQFTPTFKIKDIDNSQVFSESSFRQTWTYQNDMRLDFRSDLDGKEMISPKLVDQDIPLSENLYHEIGQQDFIGSVTGGDVVMFSGQYSFISGILEDVFVRPEVELTMEITRKQVFRDVEKDYDSVEEEVTIHKFTGGTFEIPIKMPSYQNEFEYSFRLINLPVGAEDLTTSYCFGSNINGCGRFVIMVDDEPPNLVFGSWAASRGENLVAGLDSELKEEMPTSTYHCVDISSQIQERGSLVENQTVLNWMFFDGDPEKGNVWEAYQNNYGTTPLSTTLNISGGSLGYLKASANCVDLWPVGIGQFEVTQSDLNMPGLSVNLVLWIEASDSAGSLITGAGRYNDDGSASWIEGSADNRRDSSNYLLVFEGTDFNVRNIRTIPDSPQVGDKVILEVELVNSGIPGVADLEIRSVINNGVPAFEGYIVSEVIGENQAKWVSIELAEFTDATTGMYYIVYDNETGDVLFNGKDRGTTFNVKASNSEGSGFSTGLIVIILIAVIAILAVAVVVISRRNNGVDFDDLYDDEDDKSYASIPPTQSYSTPAAQVSPEMAEAMEKFTFWTQEEIQGYFDQGWSIQQLEEWLESQ